MYEMLDQFATVTMKTKTSLYILICVITYNASASSVIEPSNLQNRFKFDPKCLLCKWTAKLIIAYHDEGQRPMSLFHVLSTLCSFLGHQDKVIA